MIFILKVPIEVATVSKDVWRNCQSGLLLLQDSGPFEKTQQQQQQRQQQNNNNTPKQETTRVRADADHVYGEGWVPYGREKGRSSEGFEGRSQFKRQNGKDPLEERLQVRHGRKTRVRNTPHVLGGGGEVPLFMQVDDKHIM